MLQFSLRNLLIAVAAVGVGTGAFLNANSWWASLLWGSALLLLVLAGLVVLFRRDAQRVFASGYLLAGGLYLALLIYSVPNGAPANYWEPYSPLHQDNLFTTRVITWMYSWFPTSRTMPYLPAAGGGGSAGAGTSTGGGGMGGGLGGGGFFGPPQTPNPSYIDYQAFANVGQALWMHLLSWLAGTVAVGLYRTRDKSKTADGAGRVTST